MGAEIRTDAPVSLILLETGLMCPSAILQCSSVRVELSYLYAWECLKPCSIRTQLDDRIWKQPANLAVVWEDREGRRQGDWTCNIRRHFPSVPRTSCLTLSKPFYPFSSFFTLLRNRQLSQPLPVWCIYNMIFSVRQQCSTQQRLHSHSGMRVPLDYKSGTLIIIHHVLHDQRHPVSKDMAVWKQGT